MAQNRSSAVMQRRSEPHDSLDDFPTPPWATRALINHVLAPWYLDIGEVPAVLAGMTAWEPACNRGYMAAPLGEIFAHVHASDVHDYGWSGQTAVTDFLFPGSEAGIEADWMITNPPFRLAQEFIAKGLEVASEGVAVLVRTSFIEGVARYRNLFADNPPTILAQFSERVPMVRGRCDPGASTATSYCWMVWAHGYAPMAPVWIPPCRQQLTLPGDYELPA